jgi:hypothetical protein
VAATHARALYASANAQRGCAKREPRSAVLHTPSRTDVSLLKAELHRRHFPHGLSDEKLLKLVRHVRAHSTGKDLIGVCADCAVQWPRPEWLVVIVGPMNLSPEMLNTEDKADPKEWGPAG